MLLRLARAAAPFLPSHIFIPPPPPPAKKKQLILTFRLHDAYMLTAHQAWIGGTDILSEGHWEWISTGLRINYTDWGAHQPDDTGSGKIIIDEIR